MNNITLEEKIDYVYKELRSQKRSKVLKLFLKITILIVSAYFIITTFQNTNKENMTKYISNTLGDIITPIVQNITNKMLEEGKAIEINGNMSEKLLEKIKNNPNLINKIN